MSQSTESPNAGKLHCANHAHSTHFAEVVGNHLGRQGSHQPWHNTGVPTGTRRKPLPFGARHESAPSPKPAEHRRLSHDFRLAPGFRCRESCEELASLLRPTSPHLASQDHQPGAAMGLSQLRISALLSPPGLVQSGPAGGGRCAIAPDWRHHCGVDGQLCSPERREAVDNDFQPVVHLAKREEIHVLHLHVGRHPSPCLPTNTGSCTFQREPPAPQYPCQQTRCPMAT